MNKKQQNITIRKEKITAAVTIKFTFSSKMHKNELKRLQNDPFKRKCYRFVIFILGFWGQKVWLFCIPKGDFFTLTPEDFWYILLKVSKKAPNITEIKNRFSAVADAFFRASEHQK